MTAQRTCKRPYKIDIAALHALCEANYVRLLRLFPDYEHSNHFRFELGEARVTIEVLERSRYTTIFRIRQYHHAATWLGNLCIEVRAYHDAAMLEVGAFQSHYRVAARYDYPNKHMLQEDEKLRQNQFLVEWFEHCLSHGQVTIDQAVTGRVLAVSRNNP